jgi:hypothetical protein
MLITSGIQHGSQPTLYCVVTLPTIIFVNTLLVAVTEPALMIASTFGAHSVLVQGWLGVLNHFQS